MIDDQVSGPVELLQARARETPDDVAVIAEGTEWTCAQLVEQSGLLAAGLRDRGVVPGDRVALHLHTTIEALLGYLGCLRAGAIAVPLNPRLTTPELRAFVERTRPVIYLGQRELYPRFAPLSEHLVPGHARFVAGSEPDCSTNDLGQLFTATAAAANPSVVPNPSLVSDPGPDPDGAAILLSTSGATGESKIVVWSHRTLAGLRLSAAGRAVESGAVLAILTPLMHSAAVYHLFNALTQRATAVLIPEFDADTTLDAITEHRITGVFGMPFMYAELVRVQRARPRDVATLRTATVAGDVCPHQIENDFHQVFRVPLRSFWAATEDVGSMTTDRRVGPFMRVIPEADIQIVRQDGSVAVAGETGELFVRSPTTSPGYWQNDTELLPMPGGVFRSGDLVCEIGPDLLRYVGRKKDTIIRAGSNISPGEVEEVLLSHPDVLDVAVAGIPDDRLGQRVAALVVLRKPQPDGRSVHKTEPTSTQAILAWAGRRLAGYKLPELVRVIDAIPRNAVTKVDRVAVRNALTR
ncbi:MAG TPA: class I adenylate-forming enzyme family protein [Pseudonocardia sp.]|nr:class I adenylate-forming enzyme family protein [Pseudonocardia sp.]